MKDIFDLQDERRGFLDGITGRLTCSSDSKSYCKGYFDGKRQALENQHNMKMEMDKKMSEQMGRDDARKSSSHYVLPPLNFSAPDPFAYQKGFQEELKNHPPFIPLPFLKFKP